MTIISGLRVIANKKTRIISVEFPYGEGLAAEFDLTPDKAMELCQALMICAFELGWKPKGRM